ncbi:hypothetical protein LTR56_004310 [Elasticomyces elasticus]|nr:hypothetical protein LTR22_012038 [Elasticomyces elasticus]KAK3653898.1 hypothetical protein LTR56_004310 [Elasticomyces elasticus]KAK4919306.1 hypothetical protein LTR49_013004 [Elasticomyces elasticus]KAK5748718.1 hypothetical protein LTS12_021229 [Elasticomyces elasticus]
MTTDQEIFAAAPQSINHDTLLDLVTRYQPKEVARRANAERKKPVLSNTNVRERLNRALTRFAKEHGLDREDVKAVHDAIRASGGKPIAGEDGADAQMPSGAKKVKILFQGTVVNTMDGVQQSISERIKLGARRRAAARGVILPAVEMEEVEEAEESEHGDAGRLLDAIEGPEDLPNEEAEAFREFDASEEREIDEPESRGSNEPERSYLDHEPSSELSDLPESMEWAAPSPESSVDHGEEADDEEEEEEEADVDEELSVTGANDHATPVVPRIAKGKGRAKLSYPRAWFNHSDPAEDTESDPEIEAAQISNFSNTLKRGRKARSLMPERGTDATVTRYEEEWVHPTFPPVWSLPFKPAFTQAGATSTSIPADDEDSGLSSAESDTDEAAIEEEFLGYEVHQLFEEPDSAEYVPTLLWDDDILNLSMRHTVREIVDHLNKDLASERKGKKHTNKSVKDRIAVAVERMAERKGRKDFEAYRAELNKTKETNMESGWKDRRVKVVSKRHEQ